MINSRPFSTSLSVSVFLDILPRRLPPQLPTITHTPPSTVFFFFLCFSPAASVDGAFLVFLADLPGAGLKIFLFGISGGFSQRDLSALKNLNILSQSCYCLRSMHLFSRSSPD